MRRDVDLPADRHVVLDGARFHYLDWGGDGRPLLLLAGLGCTAHVFGELAPHLAADFRVVALTRRDHGSTDAVSGGNPIAQGAGDARLLLDALGIERALVVGHSMGGGEVSELASRHPDRVDRVVYLDGAYDWADHPSPDRHGDATAPDRYDSFEQYADVVHGLFHDALRGPAFDAMLRASVRTEPGGAVVDLHSGPAMAPYARALAEYRHPYAGVVAPTLALYALDDDRPPAEATWREASRERFARDVVRGQAVAIAGSHYLFIDRRDEVVAALRAFLG